MQEELSLIIRSMKGIEAPSVLIDTEPKRRFGQPPVKTASVCVKPLGGEPLSDEQVEAIRYLVASAIAGLKPENVTVADLNSGRVYHGDSQKAAMAAMTPTWPCRETLRAEVEGENPRKPCATFPTSPSRPTSSSTAKKSSRTVEVKTRSQDRARADHGKEQAPHRDSGSAGGGRPGFQPEQPPISPHRWAAGGEGLARRRRERRTKTVNAVSTTSSRKGERRPDAQAGHGRRRHPDSYYEKVWRERNPAAAGEEAEEARPGGAGADSQRGVQRTIQQARRHPAAAAGQTSTDPTRTGHRHHLPGHQAGGNPGPASAAERACLAGADIGRRWAMIGLGLVEPGHAAVGGPGRAGRRRSRRPPHAAWPAGARGRRRRAGRSVAARRLRRLTRQRPLAPRRAFRTGQGRPRRGRQHSADLDRTSVS